MEARVRVRAHAIGRALCACACLVHVELGLVWRGELALRAVCDGLEVPQVGDDGGEELRRRVRLLE
eukprot:6123469-Pleurochrysis_carterae.AAC.1